MSLRRYRGGSSERSTDQLVAEYFDVSESCLQRQLKIAEAEDGVIPGMTQAI